MNWELFFDLGFCWTLFSFGTIVLGTVAHYTVCKVSNKVFAGILIVVPIFGTAAFWLLNF